MKTMLFCPQSGLMIRRATLLAVCLVSALLSCPFTQTVAAAVTAAAQTFQFDVPASCTCAACSFEVYRTVKKYEGVSKAALSVRDHRLDITFTESKHSISDLAKLLARLDMGKDSALEWPLSDGVNGEQAVGALAHIPGVRNVKLDAKTHIAHL